jgi:hypothetical protein
MASVAFGSLPFPVGIWFDKLWSAPACVADGAFEVGSGEEAWASAPNTKIIMVVAGIIHKAPHTLLHGKQLIDRNKSTKYNFQNCVKKVYKAALELDPTAHHFPNDHDKAFVTKLIEIPSRESIKDYAFDLQCKSSMPTDSLLCHDPHQGHLQ